MKSEKTLGHGCSAMAPLERRFRYFILDTYTYASWMRKIYALWTHSRKTGEKLRWSSDVYKYRKRMGITWVEWVATVHISVEEWKYIIDTESILVPRRTVLLPDLSAFNGLWKTTRDIRFLGTRHGDIMTLVISIFHQWVEFPEVKETIRVNFRSSAESGLPQSTMKNVCV